MTTDSPAQSRTNPSSRVLLAGATWLIVYVAARLVLEQVRLDLPARFAVSFAPLFAFFWFVWVVQRAVKDADELQRLVQLQALALAFSTTICVLMTLGLFDILYGGRLELPPLRDLWAILPPLYGICYAVAYQRYR